MGAYPAIRAVQPFRHSVVLSKILSGEKHFPMSNSPRNVFPQVEEAWMGDNGMILCKAHCMSETGFTGT